MFKSHIGVIKRSNREVLAVDDVSFGIQEGELFGLLGPNGASKTTTVNMLTTLLIPTLGSATVKGFDIVSQADEVRKRIGFIFGGERGLYWRLSGIDNLRYFASEKLRALPFADAISVEDQGQKQILLIQTSRGALGVVIAFTWGVVLMGLDLSNTSLPALTLTILITTVSTCGLGLLMGCLALITVNVMFVNNFVYFMLLIFSGANIPLAQLPSWIQTISHLLPLTRGIMAAREIVAGATLGDVALLLAGELGIGIAYFMMGYVLFAIFEVVAKQRGTLEVF